MGFLAALSQLFMTPVTFFEHEGRETAEYAKQLLEKNGVRVSLIDEVATEEWGMSYVIGVSDYNTAINILRNEGIL